MADSSVVWESTVDGGRYRVRVVRIAPFTSRIGELIVERVDCQAVVELYRTAVTLAYGATFGPDRDDVADWRDEAAEVIDDDYRSRGEEPPT
jgi:hypothetical protein